MKLHEIIVGKLYIRGAFRNRPIEDKLRALRAAGITAVLCTVGEDKDLKDVEGLLYIVKALPDGKRVPVDRYLEAAALVTELIVDRGYRVLVHCFAGRNRSGLVAALVTMLYFGFSGRDAVAYVRKGRPGALANVMFEQYLERLDAPV